MNGRLLQGVLAEPEPGAVAARGGTSPGDVSRRRFVHLAGAALGGLATSRARTASIEAPAGAGGLVDVHFHPIVPALLEVLRGSGTTRADDEHFLTTLRHWNVENALAAMDKGSVRMAIQSVVPPLGLPPSREGAIEFVRTSNAQAKGLARAHAGRFGLFAGLSMVDPQTSVREIAEAYDELGADGILLLSHYAGIRPGDPRLEPILAALDSRGAVAFVHPIAPPIPAPEIARLGWPHTELAFEATRTIASLLFNGAFTRFPNIRFVFTHGGAAVPMLVERWNQMAQQIPRMRAQLGASVHELLGRPWFDVATVAHPTPFAALRQMVPLSNILLGSDQPYLPLPAALVGLQHLGLAADEARAVGADNAMRLLGHS